MYLIATHIPIYTAGVHRFLESDWLSSLRLLRDSMESEYGPIAVIAPSCPFDSQRTTHSLQLVDEQDEAIKLLPSFDTRCHHRHFWLTQRRRWKSDVRDAVAQADVVHSGMSDLLRPIAHTAFAEAKRQNRATVFVRVTDVALQVLQLNAGRDLRHRIAARAYAQVFEQLSREAVSTASLSMLKGPRLMRRYQRYQRNAKMIQDTAVVTRDIVSEEQLNRRSELLRMRMRHGGALRFVYSGPLSPHKGILESLKIVKTVREGGVPIEYDIIGGGSQHREIESAILNLGLSDSVRMLGRIPFGSKLFRRLQQYDALLFTPSAEDSPRMIFDGYAAGLPLVAFDIEYVKERNEEESATWLLPSGDVARSAKRINALAKQPRRLLAMSISAAEAARFHSPENWYKRRAWWTFDAVDRHVRHARRTGHPYDRCGW